MIYFILIFIVILLLFKFRHTTIDFKSFFLKGFKKIDDDFGIICLWGKQGCSKTFNAVNLLFKNNSGCKLYANLKSLKNVNYTYINGLYELLDLVDSIKEHDHAIIFFDELFTIIFKEMKLSQSDMKRVKKMLSQMRKKGIIFITTAQEWLDIPVDWRRYVRYSVEVDMCNVLGRAFVIKRVYNGYECKWNKDENEYISPLIKTVIEKASKKIADSYDTYEQIG